MGIDHNYPCNYQPSASTSRIFSPSFLGVGSEAHPRGIRSPLLLCRKENKNTGMVIFPRSWLPASLSLHVMSSLPPRSCVPACSCCAGCSPCVSSGWSLPKELIIGTGRRWERNPRGFECFRGWQKDQKYNLSVSGWKMNACACCISTKHFLQGSWLGFDGWMKVCSYPARGSKFFPSGVEGGSVYRWPFMLESQPEDRTWMQYLGTSSCVGSWACWWQEGGLLGKKATWLGILGRNSWCFWRLLGLGMSLPRVVLQFSFHGGVMDVTPVDTVAARSPLCL